MKTLKQRISRKAAKELEDIWFNTLDNWSAEQAERYARLIFDEIAHLCRVPGSGNSMDHIIAGYHSAKVKSHLIFYRVNQNSLDVMRILHEQMDLDNRLGD